MDIQIIEIKPINQGNLRAFVKIRLGDITLNDFRIVQQAGQRAWVSVPQATWTDQGGKLHYKPIIELPANVKGQISRVILQRWSNGN